MGFILLGILVNLNKFEIHNLYQKRLEDFVHLETMQSLMQKIGAVYQSVRDSYVLVQDDTPETWTEATLHLVGVKNWAGHKKQSSAIRRRGSYIVISFTASNSSCFTSGVFFRPREQGVRQHIGYHNCCVGPGATILVFSLSVILPWSQCLPIKALYAIHDAESAHCSNNGRRSNHCQTTMFHRLETQRTTLQTATTTTSIRCCITNTSCSNTGHLRGHSHPQLAQAAGRVSIRSCHWNNVAQDSAPIQLKVTNLISLVVRLDSSTCCDALLNAVRYGS